MNNEHKNRKILIEGERHETKKMMIYGIVIFL